SIPPSVVFVRHAATTTLYTLSLHDALPISLQQRRSAIPLPWQPEARQAFRQHWLLQLGLAPGLAAVGGDLDLADAAASRPGQPTDLVEAALAQLMPGGRLRDHGFRLHREGELPCSAVRHQVGVFRGLLA